jgi:hypothetical protein
MVPVGIRMVRSPAACSRSRRIARMQPGQLANVKTG